MKQPKEKITLRVMIISTLLISILGSIQWLGYFPTFFKSTPVVVLETLLLLIIGLSYLVSLSIPPQQTSGDEPIEPPERF